MFSNIGVFAKVSIHSGIGQIPTSLCGPTHWNLQDNGPKKDTTRWTQAFGFPTRVSLRRTTQQLEFQ